MARSKESVAGGVCARRQRSPAEATTEKTAIAISVAKTPLSFVNDSRMMLSQARITAPSISRRDE